MSSQKDDSGATLGPGENEQDQQPFPGATWGEAEHGQDQQTVPTSTPQTTDDQGDVDTSPVTRIQTSGNQDNAGTTLASTTRISGNQGVANPPPATPQTTGDQGVANPPSTGGGGGGGGSSGPGGSPPSFWQRFNFVLVPLVFAILVFIFTILFAIRNHVFLPPLALAMLLLALGVMQGTLLYYIDTSKNQASREMYWHLTVIVGFALFLVVGTLAIFGFGASIFFIILLLLGSVFVAPRAIHQVPEGSIDFVTLFSKHVRTLQPGPHILWPLEKSVRLSTKEKNWEDPALKVQITRDKNGEEYDLHLRAKLKYQLDPDPNKAQQAKLKVENWEKSVQDEFVTVVKNVFKEVTPEEVNSWLQGTQAQSAGTTSTTGSTPGKTLEGITNTIKDLLQREVDDWGVKVHKVDIQDLTLIHIVTSRADPLRRPVAGQQTGPGSTGAQRTSSTTNQPVDQQPTIPVYTAPEYPPHSESEIELLKDSYEAVRQGRLTDPDTIRTLAARFQEHLYDPNLDFFPLRAAEILYSRARYYEELKNASRRAPDTVPVPAGDADVVFKDENSRKTVTVKIDL